MRVCVNASVRLGVRRVRVNVHVCLMARVCVRARGSAMRIVSVSVSVLYV